MLTQRQPRKLIIFNNIDESGDEDDYVSPDEYDSESQSIQSKTVKN